MKRKFIKALMLVEAVGLIVEINRMPKVQAKTLTNEVAVTSSLQEVGENWKNRVAKISGTPVFSLKFGDKQIYTTSTEERDNLKNQGWDTEGIAFYSYDGSDGSPVYRLSDPVSGNFVYSLSNQVGGYNLNGIAFYVEPEEMNWKEVQLTSDLNSTFIVESGEHIKLNLNGHNITSSNGAGILVKAGGYIEITGDGLVKAVSKDAALRNNGTAVINGGSYENNNNYCIINHGYMRINDADVHHTNRDCGSSLIDTGYYDFNSKNSATGYVAGQNIWSPLLEINNGNFHDGRYIIKNDDNARTYINGGNFYNAQYSVIKSWGTIDILGGTFTGRDNNYGLVSNGTVFENRDIDPGDMNIYGGVFQSSAYLFYPANNGSEQNYGNVTIHAMTVRDVTSVTNSVYNMNGGTIDGIENIVNLGNIQ